MESKEKDFDLFVLFNSIWSQKRKIIKWGIYGLVVGIVIAFSIPKEYASSVRLAPESKVSSNMAAMSQYGDLASMMGINTKGTTTGINIDVYPEIVKSTPFLREFSKIEVPYNGQTITLFNYLTKEQEKAWWKYVISAPGQFIGWIFSSSESKELSPNVEDLTNPSGEVRLFEYELAQRMDVEQDKKSKLIMMSVRMQDPKIAAIIADSLHIKLSRYVVDYYTAKARNDLESSQNLLAQAKANYFKADSDYATVVDRNQNLITKTAQIKIERYKNERDIAYMVYQQLAQQVESNKITLQQETPIATVVDPPRVANEASSPNKKMIIFAFAFLAVMACVGVIIVKQIAKRTPSN